MRKFLILLGILFFLAFQGQAAETTWRHSGSEVTGYDYNFTNKYGINNVLWINGTNLNVSDVRQDLNFNNKNISQVELVNNVNFSDFAKAVNHEITIINDTGTAKAFWNGSLLYSGAAQTVINSSALLLQNTGGNIKISCGNYTNVDNIYIYSNTIIMGSGNCTQIEGSGSTTPVFLIQGTLAYITDITANINKGDQLITVTSTTGLNIEDYIIIQSSRRTTTNNQPYGEVQKIISIPSSTTIFIPGTYDFYLSSDIANVSKVSYINDVIFKNFNINGKNPLLAKVGIQVSYGRNIIIDNINSNNFGEAHVDFYSSIDSRVQNSFFTKANAAGTAYGIVLADATDNILIQSNIFSDISRHGTTLGGSRKDGIARNIKIISNTFRNTTSSACSDEHNGGNTLYYHNTYINCQYAFFAGAQDIVFDGNKIINSSQIAIQHRDDVGGETRNLIIRDNEIVGGKNSRGIWFDQWVGKANIRVSGNNISNVTTAIKVNGTSEIKDNSIQDFTTCIWLVHGNFSAISGNTCKFGSGTGIKIEKSFNSTVYDNNFFESSLVGISEATFADNNSIYDNRLESGSTITLLGLNSTSRQNVGILPYYPIETSKGIVQTNNNIKLSDNNDTQLVLNVRADENKSGVVLNPNVYDSSIYGNHGTFIGNATTNYSDGIFGTALSLDGTNDYVSFGKSSVVNPQSSFTISAWIKPNTLSGSHAIISKQDSSGASGGNGFYLFQGSQTITFYLYDGAGNRQAITSGNILNSNWNHIIAIWDNSNINLYFNSNLIGTLPVTGFSPATAQSLTVGAYSYTGTILYNGSLDSIKMYNRALNQTEVLSLYNELPLSQNPSLIQANNFTIVNSTGAIVFQTSATGVIQNLTIPVCSKSIVNQTGSMCLNMTSEPTPNFPQMNIWNGTRWTFMNGTGV